MGRGEAAMKLKLAVSISSPFSFFFMVLQAVHISGASAGYTVFFTDFARWRESR
jgi:hypothetical protein